MPKRTRSRTRARVAGRASDAAVRSARAAGYRAGAVTRATGAPSGALQKAAAWERGYVVKDFRRIAVVVAIMLVLLLVSGVAVSALLK